MASERFFKFTTLARERPVHSRVRQSRTAMSPAHPPSEMAAVSHQSARCTPECTIIAPQCLQRAHLQKWLQSHTRAPGALHSAPLSQRSAPRTHIQKKNYICTRTPAHSAPCTTLAPERQRTPHCAPLSHRSVRRFFSETHLMRECHTGALRFTATPQRELDLHFSNPRVSRSLVSQCTGVWQAQTLSNKGFFEPCKNISEPKLNE